MPNWDRRHTVPVASERQTSAVEEKVYYLSSYVDRVKSKTQVRHHSHHFVEQTNSQARLTYPHPSEC